MRSSNLLFFRNIRSYYYVRIQDTLQPLEVYRWRAFAARPPSPQIQPLRFYFILLRPWPSIPSVAARKIHP
ncbi:MAG: hypothetical protein ACKOA7_06175 [Bacteroidota bacterium]